MMKKFKRGETIPISIPNPALQAESWTLKRVIVYRGSVNSDNKIIFEPDQTTANQETTAYLALIPSDITAVMTVGEWHIETVCTNGKLIDITESKEYFLLSESAENRTRETQTTFDTMQFVPIQNPISGEVTILDLATVNAEIGVIGNVIIQEVITDFDYSILAEPYQEGQAYADGALVTNNKQLYRVEGGALVQVTIADELNLKVDKQEGKQLSSNDYTDYDKAKLATIEEGAQGNVQSNWNETDESADSYIRNKPTIPTVPTAVSAFDNDAQYLQSSDIAEWAKQPSKPMYTANEVGALPNTTVIPDVPDNISAFNNDSGYITIADSANISKQSVLYMINNGHASKTLIITLHPTAYERLINDTDIISALTAHSNISLASA